MRFNCKFHQPNEFQKISLKCLLLQLPDIDEMPYVFPWTGTDDHLVFRFHSSNFFNKYVELYGNKKTKTKRGYMGFG